MATIACKLDAHEADWFCPGSAGAHQPEVAEIFIEQVDWARGGAVMAVRAPSSGIGRKTLVAYERRPTP